MCDQEEPPHHGPTVWAPQVSDLSIQNREGQYLLCKPQCVMVSELREPRRREVGETRRQAASSRTPSRWASAWHQIVVSLALSD